MLLICSCCRGDDDAAWSHLCYSNCQDLDIGDDYCGQYGINHPIHGPEAVSRRAVITWPGVSVTSLAIDQSGNYTVAFVGTSDGYIKKVNATNRFWID